KLLRGLVRAHRGVQGHDLPRHRVPDRSEPRLDHPQEGRGLVHATHPPSNTGSCGGRPGATGSGDAAATGPRTTRGLPAGESPVTLEDLEGPIDREGVEDVP